MSVSQQVQKFSRRGYILAYRLDDSAMRHLSVPSPGTYGKDESKLALYEHSVVATSIIMATNQKFVFFGLSVVFLIWTDNVTLAKKLVLVSETSCDRYSLDALYHERYELQLKQMQAEITSFADHILDKIFNDIQEVGTKVPGNEGSTVGEQKMFERFSLIKKKLKNKIEVVVSNVTQHWELFLNSTNAFLGSKKEGSPERVMDHAKMLYDAYVSAKAMYQKQMSAVVVPIKAIAFNSLKGVQQIAGIMLNKSSENKTDHVEIMIKAIKEVSPNFIGKLTIRVIEDEIDVTSDEPSKEDKTLHDDVRAIEKIKNKVLVNLRDAVDDFVKPSEDKINLMRRNLYMYLATETQNMYEERKKTGITPRTLQEAQRQYQTKWEDDETLAEKALFLAQCY